MIPSKFELWSTFRPSLSLASVAVNVPLVPLEPFFFFFFFPFAASTGVTLVDWFSFPLRVAVSSPSLTNMVAGSPSSIKTKRASVISEERLPV